MPARVLLHVLLRSADTLRAGGVCFALLHVRVCALDRGRKGGRGGGRCCLHSRQEENGLTSPEM